MQLSILAFFSGIVIVQQWTELPQATEWLLLILLSLILYKCQLRLASIFLAGIWWAAVFAHWQLSTQLEDGLQGKDVQVKGYIVSLPHQQENRVSFDFIVTQAQDSIPGKLRLNWYYPLQVIRAGQSWEMTVRLKKPHARSNPGAADYEAWLFAHGIGATGYVRPNPSPQLIPASFRFSRLLASWRQAISERLDLALPNSEHLGIIKALSIGSQDLISPAQWQIFRATGVVHLMVISGAHISLLSGLVFYIFRRFWVWTGVFQISPQNVAALMAWLFALFYALLAGFSVPAQRAVLMLSVGLLSIVLQRNTAPLQVLLMALLSVVLFDPLALLSSGFWLSFSAVALLIYVSAGRIGKTKYWLRISKLHVAMAIGLAPLLMVFFQQISIISPLANWLAIPLIGLLLTPLCLLSALVVLVSIPLAALILWPADLLLKAFWWVLQEMAAWPMATLSCLQPPWYGVLFAILGILLLFAPKGMPMRYLSPVFFLPLIFVTADRPKSGEVWLTLLDVGQGLAAVVQTRQHTLVYDSGPKFSEHYDMGEAVVLPYLQYFGIKYIDMLMISHGDIDHSGGAASIIEAIQVKNHSSSDAKWSAELGGDLCRAGQNWQWDGVIFEVLSPAAPGFDSENNNSCVLTIKNSKFSFLLTGDIEKTAEYWLIEQYGSKLASSVLITPHHGSKSSSSLGFLKLVAPQYSLIPAGYRNKFGFPHPKVLNRHAQLGIKTLNTAEVGAIRVMATGQNLTVTANRLQNKRYWHQ